MRPILIVAALAGILAAGGCSSSGSAPSPQADVYAAKASYGAALTVAVRYNGLPRCGAPTSPPICSDAAVVLQLRRADAVASVALDQAESVVRSPLSSASLIAAAAQSATGAVKVLQAVITSYGVK